jgi:hypothetical protein
LLSRKEQLNGSASYPIPMETEATTNGGSTKLKQSKIAHQIVIFICLNKKVEIQCANRLHGDK